MLYLTLNTMISSDFGIDQLPYDNDAFTVETQLTDFIRVLETPKNDKESFVQFMDLYKLVPIETWCDSELVFDIGNFIMRYRPDLISLGIRLNVQVNLFLRSIQKYALDPETIFQKVGHSIGAFALTEEDAGVLSGLIVDTTWSEKEGEYILNTQESQKNWISQGMMASYAIVYARHTEDKNDIRVFMVDLSDEHILKTPIKTLPVNNTLDMAKLRFKNYKVPSEFMLENSKKSTKLELLNGIFYGRYMIAEATISAMLGFIDHLKTNIYSSSSTLQKFTNLGHTQYLEKCRNNFNDYKSYLYTTRLENLSGELTNINCYKIYAVEKSIEIFNKLQLMFGMRAAIYPLRFENLLLHKVAEGDTHVLRASLINNHSRNSTITLLTQPGFSFKHIYYLYQCSDKREKFEYIMEHLKEISDNIVVSTIPTMIDM